MATQGDEGRLDDATSIFNDSRVMNGVVRLLVAVSGTGCVALAGYQALYVPEPWVTTAFLTAAVVLLLLALAAEPTTPSP